MKKKTTGFCEMKKKTTAFCEMKKITGFCEMKEIWNLQNEKNLEFAK